MSERQKYKFEWDSAGGRYRISDDLEVAVGYCHRRKHAKLIMDALNQWAADLDADSNNEMNAAKTA